MRWRVDCVPNGWLSAQGDRTVPEPVSKRSINPVHDQSPTSQSRLSRDSHEIKTQFLTNPNSIPDRLALAIATRKFCAKQRPTAAINVQKVFRISHPNRIHHELRAS
jgi:hypothetical protein